MLLGCQKTWIDPETGSRYEAGNTYDVNDRKAAPMYLRAPDGTFDVFGQDPPQRPKPPEPPEAQAASAVTEDISEQTASDMNVPDRRARGGKKRTKRTGTKRPEA